MPRQCVTPGSSLADPDRSTGHASKIDSADHRSVVAESNWVLDDSIESHFNSVSGDYRRNLRYFERKISVQVLHDLAS